MEGKRPPLPRQKHIADAFDEREGCQRHGDMFNTISITTTCRPVITTTTTASNKSGDGFDVVKKGVH
jgi:hypothetical protein